MAKGKKKKTRAARTKASAQGALPPGIVSSEKATTFKRRVEKINASDRFFEALAEQPDPGPIINLNFLRYRPRQDPTRYNLYGAAAGAAINAVGGTVVFHAARIEPAKAVAEWDDSWDGVALPVYPRRASYNQLQLDESYQLAIPDRVAGTYERLLYVLSDGDEIFDGTISIKDFHEGAASIAHEPGAVFVAELLRFAKPKGRAAYERFAKVAGKLIAKAGGAPVLSLRAEMPIVSEQEWDHFTLTRYPSMDALQEMLASEEWQAASADRSTALDAFCAFPTKTEGMP